MLINVGNWHKSNYHMAIVLTVMVVGQKPSLELWPTCSHFDCVNCCFVIGECRTIYRNNLHVVEPCEQKIWREKSEVCMACVCGWCGWWFCLAISQARGLNWRIEGALGSSHGFRIFWLLIWLTTSQNQSAPSRSSRTWTSETAHWHIAHGYSWVFMGHSQPIAIV